MPDRPTRPPFSRSRPSPAAPGQPVIAHACVTHRQRRVLREFGFLTQAQWRQHSGEAVPAWLHDHAVFSVPLIVPRLSPLSPSDEVILRFQLVGVRPHPSIGPILQAWAGLRQGWDLAYWFTASNDRLPQQARPVDLLDLTPTLLAAVALYDAHHHPLPRGHGPRADPAVPRLDLDQRSQALPTDLADQIDDRDTGATHDPGPR